MLADGSTGEYPDIIALLEFADLFGRLDAVHDRKLNIHLPSAADVGGQTHENEMETTGPPFLNRLKTVLCRLMLDLLLA